MSAAGPAGVGQQGGAAGADFDALIELVTSTVAPDTWAENGGGEAEIRPFPTGVWLDPAGVVISANNDSAERPSGSRAGRFADPSPAASGDSDARRPAAMRCVSLPRLEAEIARRIEAGEPLDEAMLTLAGLQRAEWLCLLPAGADGRAGDVVIAGPAGDWRVDPDRRLVSTETGRAVVRLDDLLTLLRREASRPGRPLGCAITPRQEALAAAQAELDKTAGAPIPARGRDAWLENLRRSVGQQDVDVWGVDPATNAARVLVEADRHMKQIGLGEAPSIDAVPSYLDRVAERVRDGQPAPPMSVLRWWFAAGYDAIHRDADATSFRLVGSGVRVLSENELLTLRGERVHTGESDEPTEGFADDFTKHFDELCAVYAVYSELRNVFDLAVLAALVQSESLVERSGWRPKLFFEADALPTPRLRHARRVDTMATLRVVGRRNLLAAVSGGAWLEPSAIARSDKGLTADAPPAPAVNHGGWWWDAP
ncbi:DUF1598 domain-containing protein [Botrimarina sp.]|uniref:DUF1598 domain-containing protein n=1 Tax=Botrimarina sp. TaxID=2795802 RepID=UPI0032EF09C8